MGYDRDRFFVHQVTTGKSKRSTNTGTTAGGSGSGGGGGGASKGAGKLQVAKRPPLQPQQPWIMPQAVASGPAMRGQVFSEFTNIYFPQSIDTSYALDVWHYLISGFSTLPKKTEMLDKAIAALACFYLGKQRKDDRLFHHGIQLYNSAIRHLSIMMSQNNYCDDIVYTTIVFQEIEVCHYGGYPGDGDEGEIKANAHVLPLVMLLPPWPAYMGRTYCRHQCDPKALSSKGREEPFDRRHLQSTPKATNSTCPTRLSEFKKTFR